MATSRSDMSRSTHPYEPLGTNVLLRSANPKKVGGIIIPDTAKAPERQHSFELVAVGNQCEIVESSWTGLRVMVKPGGSVYPFPVEPADEFVYYIADETDLAAIVK